MNEQVSDEVVQSTINRAILRARGGEGDIVDQVSRAFRSLQSLRRTDRPEDINLAAAEHYMYARFLAGATGDPLVKATPVLYGAKKRVYFALGIQDRMASRVGPEQVGRTLGTQGGKGRPARLLGRQQRTIRQPFRRVARHVARGSLAIQARLMRHLPHAAVRNWHSVARANR
ncbi:hypothetical protein [Burkholderia ubonensis]|uniref:hypothetical protein n=1 Tax=Burkholderia ubonensis TaxID=101571 RepID=UPI000753AA09|nr:hypothetical protein [Burkholderia ubonensis]KVC78238.1 hypothetical protein WI75_14490 [Burkholderia ubonensis]